MTNASDPAAASRRAAEEVLASLALRLEEVRERAAEDAEWRAADDMGLGAASWHLALPERIEQVHDDRAYLLTVVDALADRVAKADRSAVAGEERRRKLQDERDALAAQVASLVVERKLVDFIDEAASLRDERARLEEAS